MDLEGIRFLTINDKKSGALIDIRMYFTASNGHMTAIYEFDKSSTKADQSTATKAIENATTLTKMKESVRVVGQDAVNAIVKSQQVGGSYNTLVPNGSGAAQILIGKVQKDSFSVRVSIDQKKGQNNINLEVPFKGDPGALNGKTFHGSATYLTESIPDVAKFKLALYNIPDTP